MPNYVGQDITGLDLSGQNLTGVDFTNANATNVIFTNAIITNAIFKNTLITGATLTGITFSDLQKGHLLLRAANHTNTAVNNLTSLTPTEFRIIQPAVSTDTIARISTVTVKIPNSQGEGYTVSVTPVISQLICIFVATNQNIIITTGATQIRTIRSNGTVVQDVTNGNTTLNYLKIDSISYRLTVGNGDGVIAMIPVDLNVYQVNGSGLGDIVSLNVGSASTTLNMNNNGITNVSSIQGWNVKEITAGTGVGVTATNGSYAISNSAVVRDISAGTGITVSTASGVATISNSAVVRDVGAGTGITVSTASGVATISNSAVVRDVGAGTGITVSTTGGVATITNSAVVRDITAGTGITVSTTGGVATISNNSAAGTQNAREALSAVNHVGLVPLKLPHYAQNWTQINTGNQVFDIFMSQDGENCAYIPNGNNFIQISLDYGATWSNSNLTGSGWTSICGSTTGEVMYIARLEGSTGSAPNVIYTSRLYVSYNYGVFWSELTLDRTIGAANTWYNRSVDKIRCSADGGVIMVSTIWTTTASNVANNGTVYISQNNGGSWSVRSITGSASVVADMCLSSNGAIMFAGVSGVLGGSSTDNGNGGIYRSFDYGANWTRVRNQISAGSYFFGVIKCDATGRFLVACDRSEADPTGGGQIQTSDDFGSGWTWFGDELARGGTAAYVSPGGNLMITLHNQTYNSRIRYTQDYGRSWTNAIDYNSVIGGGSARLISIASNYDGTVILTRDNISTSRVHRCIEERGKLEVAATSRDLTITPAFGGGYTLLNNPTQVLWYSGITNQTTDIDTIYLDDFRIIQGKIDLNQYDIRYEMDINWDYTSSGYFPAYIHLGLNSVQASSVTDISRNNAQTSWTNLTQPTYTTAAPLDQMFNSRFLCGYSAGQGTGAAYRYRTTLSGTISLTTRTNQQIHPAFSNDIALNSRLIKNDFVSNSYLLEQINTNQFRIFTGDNNVEAGQQTVRGFAIWDASYENLWNLGSSGGNDLNSGVFRLYLRFTDVALNNRPRGAEVKYRIYRVRK